MFRRSTKGDHRTAEQIREHYEIEKELADKLRRASRQERRCLYSSLYDELCRRVPLHPQLTRKSSLIGTTRAVAKQMRFLRPFLDGETTFLEVGPGDCALSFEVAKFVKQVYAVDVCDEIAKRPTAPANFRFMLSDGCCVPVPAGTVDVAYSNQLLEHLHPDDALEQTRSIRDALAPGGLYICITPNRLAGPYDVSRYFDAVATGFHLREYTIEELHQLLTQVGFSRVRVYVGANGIYRRFPLNALLACERMLQALPPAVRDSVAHSAPFRALLNCRVVGIK